MTTANSSQSVEEWAKDLPKRNAASHTIRHRYQIRHCGPEEFQVRNGGEEVWADGLDFKRALLQESKFTKDPAKSPFVVNSKVPDFIRKKAVRQVEDEFARYAAVINDVSTPVVGLEVIVNMSEIVPFFKNLLDQYNIAGHIVVKP